MGALQRRRTMLDLVPPEYADGLVLHFDAIDNKGTGEHDSTYQNWVDKVSKTEWAQKIMTGGSKINFNDNYFQFNGANYFQGPSTAHNDAYGTMEIVIDDTTASASMMVFQASTTGSGRNALIYVRNGKVCFGTSKVVEVQAGVHTYAYNGTTAFIDGEVSTSSGTTTWSGFRFQILGGYSNNYASSSYKYTGKLYALRCYDRNLSAAEIMSNHLLDKARFNL